MEALESRCGIYTVQWVSLKNNGMLLSIYWISEEEKPYSVKT